MISRQAAVISVAIWNLILWTSPSQADLGGNPPRWGETDIANLNADLVAFLVGEYRLKHKKWGIATQLGLSRQKQLLGSADEEGPTFEEALRDWWMANVIDPAMRIAENPATPCKLAQIVLTRLVEAERQAQLLGLASGPGGDVSDPDSVMSRAFKAAKRRCLEEAYDACMASGNGQHIILMLTQAVRQFQLLSIEDADFEAQAVYLYRRCTVYQLRYHSQSQLSGTSLLTIGSQSDGSIILLSDVDPAQGFAGLTQPNEWRGPRPEDPIDALGSTTVCESNSQGTSYVCGSPVPIGTPGLARIKAGDLAMRRFYDEIEVNLYSDETELEELTRLAKRIPRKPLITRAPKSEGTDALTVTFLPWPLRTPVTIRYSKSLAVVPVLDSLAAFLFAHSAGTPTGTIDVKGWTRAGRDVLFEKLFSGSRNDRRMAYSDTTRFELAHRPDLFPSDEIVAKWELTPTSEPPAATRKPLLPSSAPQ